MRSSVANRTATIFDNATRQSMKPIRNAKGATVTRGSRSDRYLFSTAVRPTVSRTARPTARRKNPNASDARTSHVA